MARKKKGPLRIDIRDQRIPDGGRFTCAARTTSAPEFRQREAAVRALIDAGDFDILDRIRATGKLKLHLADVQRAVMDGDVDRLRVGRREGLLRLGATADRLIQRKEATRREGTARQVRFAVQQLEAHFGVERDEGGCIVRDVDLIGVTTKECEAWLHGVKQTGAPWAPRTQTVRHAYAQQLWDLAIHEEMEAAEAENRKARLTRNPWKNVEPAPIEPTRVIFLSAPERDRMLDILGSGKRRHLRAFMAVAYHAGLRLGETCHLRTDVDVDLEKGVLRIQSRPGQWAWKPKTANGEREVPINADLRFYLEEHARLGFAGQRFFFRAPHKDHPLSKDTARNWWQLAYTEAGIKYGRSDADAVVYHTGRHTFASLLIQQGESPLIVAELLGDKYQEVIDTYGHLTPRDLERVVRKLESGSVSAKSSTVFDADPRNPA